MLHHLVQRQGIVRVDEESKLIVGIGKGVGIGVGQPFEIRFKQSLNACQRPVVDRVVMDEAAH